MLIARMLIVVAALWLPVQSMAATDMALCHQMQQSFMQHMPDGTLTVDTPFYNQTDSEAPQTCRLCLPCAACPMPYLGADQAAFSFQSSFSFEPVAQWQPHFRSLDVLEHPPRPSSL